MMFSWWFMWMMFMFLFLVAPMGYGWGYRGWGPPYPRYVQRRRGERATLVGSSFNHHSWGLGGDLVWILMAVGLCWVMTAYWWNR